LELLSTEVQTEREAYVRHFDGLDTKAGVLLGFSGVLVALSTSCLARLLTSSWRVDMSDDQKVPPESPPEAEKKPETEPPPPFDPDLEAITYIERGPSPQYTPKRFHRDPGAEARRHARKHDAKKRRP
jgi:hypothetical protein